MARASLEVQQAWQHFSLARGLLHANLSSGETQERSFARNKTKHQPLEYPYVSYTLAARVLMPGGDLPAAMSLPLPWGLGIKNEWSMLLAEAIAWAIPDSSGGYLAMRLLDPYHTRRNSGGNEKKVPKEREIHKD